MDLMIHSLFHDHVIVKRSSRLIDLFFSVKCLPQSVIFMCTFFLVVSLPSFFASSKKKVLGFGSSRLLISLSFIFHPSVFLFGFFRTTLRVSYPYLHLSQFIHYLRHTLVALIQQAEGWYF